MSRDRTGPLRSIAELTPAAAAMLVRGHRDRQPVSESAQHPEIGREPGHRRVRDGAIPFGRGPRPRPPRDHAGVRGRVPLDGHWLLDRPEARY